jgi:hypothetical protein
VNATGEVVTRVAVGLATWCAGAATLKADTANAAKRAKRMAAMLRILFDGFRRLGVAEVGSGSVARATTQLSARLIHSDFAPLFLEGYILM